MKLLMVILSALLFFVLTPGIVVRLPPNGNKFTVAGVHAVVFALLFWIGHKLISKFGHRFRLEGFADNEDESKENKK